MQTNEKPSRRSSAEEKRIFRSARFEYIEIGRITGLDAATAEFLRAADVTPANLIKLEDWSETGLSSLMLTRLPVVVGSADGSGPLAWLANPEVLLAAKQHWPASTRIPALLLAHQVTERTRRIVAAGWMFAASTPSLSAATSPAAMYQLWRSTIEHCINPLASSLKMNFVRATGCDSRKLPPARPQHGLDPDAAT